MDQGIFSEKDRKIFDDLLIAAEPFLHEQELRDVLRPPNFNIFQVLGHVYRETSTHSALLAHLLNPDGSHGQKSAFLSHFFDIILEAARNQEKSTNVRFSISSQSWICRREVSTKYGQIDILLRNPEHLIVIENKIHARDQKNQLSRYRKFAQNEVSMRKLKSFLILYLTPEGAFPTEHGLGDWAAPWNELICLSYSREIDIFLDKSISSLIEDKAISIREILIQYKQLVRSLI